MVIATFCQNLLIIIKNIVKPNSPSIDSNLGQEIKVTLDRRSNECSEDTPAVVLGDIEQCTIDLKRNKAGGCDRVMNEHLVFGDL